LVGPLPKALQHVTAFSAGIVARSTNREGAAALIRSYSSPEAAKVMRRMGLEPAFSP
jgi:molybdate transport system substrate-binding protein